MHSVSRRYGYGHAAHSTQAAAGQYVYTLHMLATSRIAIGHCRIGIAI